MATRREVRKEIGGEMRRGDAPNREPLERLVDEALAARFMWMFDVELEDGTLLHAYKDHLTRGYLYLSEDLRAFAWIRKGRYREVDPGAALLSVFISPREAGRLTDVEEAALRLTLAKLDARCDASD